MVTSWHICDTSFRFQKFRKTCAGKGEAGREGKVSLHDPYMHACSTSTGTIKDMDDGLCWIQHPLDAFSPIRLVLFHDECEQYNVLGPARCVL